MRNPLRWCIGGSAATGGVLFARHARRRRSAHGLHEAFVDDDRPEVGSAESENERPARPSPAEPHAHHETDALDVLLIETEPYVGLHSSHALGAAGHHIHRCFPSSPTADLPEAGEPRLCVALTGGTCPIASGRIDVAVVAGPAATDRIALTAAGVTCALRHSIPLVADDSCRTTLGPQLARRANGDVAAACRRAADRAFDDLRADIIRRIAPSIARDQLEADAFEIRCTTDGPRLRVTIVGPPVERSLRQLLGVRVLDAVRAADRVFGQVDVAFEPTDG